MANSVSLESIVALCKRRGFVFPSAEIYGGINGVYDFGPLGMLLRSNIRNLWTRHVSQYPEEIVFLEGALLGPKPLWEASGHLENFTDPMVDCTNCKKRYRADDIDLEKSCPHCGQKKWTDVRQFQMMFETQLGAVSENASVAYLRPETAQAIFVNFKNVFSTSRVKVPFGIAQIGKAFRNEITPKQFLFRMREFEQMELEFFVHADNAHHYFETWIARRGDFYKTVGLKQENIRFKKHEKHELAHYAHSCTDVEYQFPFGWRELEGIAYRTDFDLFHHSTKSGKELAVFDEETKTSYSPHVVETSVGVDRLFLALLCDAYVEEAVEGEEERTVLKLHPTVAPIQAAVFPLVKKLNEPAEKLYLDLKARGYRVQFDTSGSIGKRYRRQDEIGTPVCFTFDFDSLEDNCITARNRDTLAQERISLDKVAEYLENIF